MRKYGIIKTNTGAATIINIMTFNSGNLDDTFFLKKEIKYNANIISHDIM